MSLASIFAEAASINVNTGNPDLIGQIKKYDQLVETNFGVPSILHILVNTQSVNCPPTASTIDELSSMYLVGFSRTLRLDRPERRVPLESKQLYKILEDALKLEAENFKLFIKLLTVSNSERDDEASIDFPIVTSIGESAYTDLVYTTQSIAGSNFDIKSYFSCFHLSVDIPELYISNVASALSVVTVLHYEMKKLLLSALNGEVITPLQNSKIFKTYGAMLAEFYAKQAFKIENTEFNIQVFKNYFPNQRIRSEHLEQYLPIKDSASSERINTGDSDVLKRLEATVKDNLANFADVAMKSNGRIYIKLHNPVYIKRFVDSDIFNNALIEFPPETQKAIREKAGQEIGGFSFDLSSMIVQRDIPKNITAHRTVNLTNFHTTSCSHPHVSSGSSNDICLGTMNGNNKGLSIRDLCDTLETLNYNSPYRFIEFEDDEVLAPATETHSEIKSSRISGSVAKLLAKRYYKPESDVTGLDGFKNSFFADIDKI